MKTKVNLQYFLGKKRATLSQFCKKNGVKSHDELCMILDDLGVENPKKDESAHVFRKPHRPQKPTMATSASAAERPKRGRVNLAKSSKSRKRTKS